MNVIIERIGVNKEANNIMKMKWSKVVVFFLISYVIAFSIGCNDVSTEDYIDNGSPEYGTGDGTYTFTLNVSNSQEAQAQYNLIFGSKDVFEKGEAATRFYSIPITPGIPITVNYYDFLAHIEAVQYGEDQWGDTVSVSVVRTEDIGVRNPLMEPLVLEFIDSETCKQGYDFNLEITDQSLLALYPEGTLLVRIVSESGEGGYVEFRYKTPESSMVYRIGRGSQGPDFLVDFSVSEFSEKKITEADLVITDFGGGDISDIITLQFDGNGYCTRGQYIEITTR